MTKLDNIIFIDVETVAQTYEFNQIDETKQKLWEKKSKRLCEQNNYSPEEAYLDKAGIYAEFGKIVTIVIGFYKEKFGNHEFITKIFSGHDEKQLLAEFADTIRDRGQNYIFCGHNILEFDLPYMGRRMLVNNIKIPPMLQLQNKKPRDIHHVDTMNLWKFGDRKSYASLELLAATFGIPTPKDDIDGSQVNEVYHKEADLQRINTYCEKDVKVTAKVYFALTQQQEKIDTIQL